MWYCVNTSDIRIASYYALRSWGYTRDEAEQEGRIALWKLGRDINKAFLVKMLTRKEIDKKRRLKNKSSIHCQFEDYDYPVEMELEDFGRIIKNLPEDRQELLTMTFYFGFSGQEIADYFNISKGTVKSRINRACKKLRN